MTRRGIENIITFVALLGIVILTLVYATVGIIIPKFNRLKQGVVSNSALAEVAINYYPVNTTVVVKSVRGKFDIADITISIVSPQYNVAICEYKPLEHNITIEAQWNISQLFSDCPITGNLICIDYGPVRRCFLVS